MVGRAVRTYRVDVSLTGGGLDGIAEQLELFYSRNVIQFNTIVDRQQLIRAYNLVYLPTYLPISITKRMKVSKPSLVLHLMVNPS